MSPSEEFSDKAWDGFLEFVSPCDESLTPEQVRAELKQAGLDPFKATSRVQFRIQQARAKAALASAKQHRPNVLARLKEIAVTHADTARAQLTEIIQSMKTQDRAVYARKLETASSEQDMLSLIEDLARLDALDEGNDAGA
jgi:hypothetical protein